LINLVLNLIKNIIQNVKPNQIQKHIFSNSKYWLKIFSFKKSWYHSIGINFFQKKCQIIASRYQ